MQLRICLAKCWWLLKIEPNAWAGGKDSCAVCIDLQAVRVLKFFAKLYSLAKGFGPFLREVWAGFRERKGSIFSNHQHFAISTGICSVACPLPTSRVDKPHPSLLQHGRGEHIQGYSRLWSIRPIKIPAVEFFSNIT